MTIPDSLLQQTEHLPELDQALTLLAIKRYMQNGSTLTETTDDALTTFEALRPQIDRILRRRAYARAYRARRKARLEKLRQKAEQPEQSEQPAISKLSETPEKSERSEKSEKSEKALQPPKEKERKWYPGCEQFTEEDEKLVPEDTDPQLKSFLIKLRMKDRDEKKRQEGIRRFEEYQEQVRLGLRRAYPGFLTPMQKQPSFFDDDEDPNP